MSKSLDFITSTLMRPMVFVVAGDCRLTFVMLMRSESTMVKFLTPLRTSPSATQLPTPPMPKMMTRISEIRFMASLPTRRVVRLKMFSS